MYQLAAGFTGTEVTRSRHSFAPNRLHEFYMQYRHFLPHSLTATFVHAADRH